MNIEEIDTYVSRDEIKMKITPCVYKIGEKNEKKSREIIFEKIDRCLNFGSIKICQFSIFNEP